MTQTVPADVETWLTDTKTVAHLATCTDSRPHVAPVWYRYDDGTVQVTVTGKKLENIRENPRVALSIQADENGIPEWMVTIRGTATVLDDPESTVQNRRLNQKYDVEPAAWEENRAVSIEVGSVTATEY